MEDIKTNFIRNNFLLYIFTAVVVSVIIIFSINTIYAEENDKKPLDLWENNSLLSKDEDKKKELNSVSTNNIINAEEEIDQSKINASNLDSIGVYDESNGGFSIGVWKNSNFDQIEYLLNKVPPDSRNTVLKKLINKSLLTISNPPVQKNKNEKIFFDLKIAYLEKAANYNEIEKLFGLIPEDDLNDDLINKYITSKLINGDYKSICRLDNQISEGKFKLEINSFCKAMSNNLPALDLMISLLIEEDIADQDLLYIYYSYINQTEIDLKRIKNLDIKKINLISNLGIDFSEYIDENSPLELQLFFIYSKLKAEDKKVVLAENLLSTSTLESSVLGDIYKQYFTGSNLNTSVDYLNMESSMKKRVGIYNLIRSTSDQSKLPKLLSLYVDEMGSQKLLLNSANLVYDKAKIITPKQSYKNDVLPICVILLINNDIEKCNEWLDVLTFDKESKEIIKKIKFYLFLKNDDDQIKSSVLNNAENYVSLESLDDLDKNIIAKFFSLRQENQFLEFWRSKNDMSRTSGITINIKLIEYLNQIKDISVGEAILLSSIIYGNNNEHSKDLYALFSIIKTLEVINPSFTDEFLFEYFANNLI
ncbi:MAG: hypothetical protein ACJZ41_02390 [Candidatus Pelagibacterales bacterium]